MDFKTDKSLAGKLYISLLGIAGFMSFIPFLGLISIAIFVINFLTAKRILRTTSLFFSLAILVNLIFFLFVYPKGEKLRKEFNRSGFHEEAVESTKKRLSTINDQIQEYAQKHGELPQKLTDINVGLLGFYDFSYRIKTDDGQQSFKLFYYEKTADSFYLCAVGPDGLPKTKDDILPNSNK
jgi:energy-coupling factor transporter transmembrane protein EcfT